MLGIASRTISDHEAILRALEKRDLKTLKRILRKSIILPKMIHQSRYRQSGDRYRADK